MDYFEYRDGVLCAEGVALPEIAERFGTPCYVYSAATIARHYRVFDEALAGIDHEICFAVKANGNIGVLGLLADLGSGFDIVSVGELERVITAGGDPAKIVFSGVGKRVDEIERALEVGIACFNVESEAELERLDAIAQRVGKTAPVSLRVNPDVDAQTHPYIATGLKENKFGVDIARAEALYARAAEMPGLMIRGVDCHIGSQLTQLAPFRDAVKRVLALIDRLAERDIVIDHLDVGGGLGIRYRDETPPSPAAYAENIRDLVADRDLKLVFEPGRVLVGNAGVLLTRVELLKPGQSEDDKHFAVVDAAMNDLLRPALYDGWHEIVAVAPRGDTQARAWEIVGPICETGDFLGHGRELALAANDLLAVRSAGAYGFTMASSYNARPRVAEIMVDGDIPHEVRARETVADLMRGEKRLPFV
ncbi:Diaminopimelate decarboxylase protein [Salinisphaera shabanensis E1L3A]|jgi:diaminopimelate decarboxylase|uniref:Diaminopimelate decarboxylase n=1 Tax=Salinisphaera shabanensis E1L3A TaxID=1033802 RepID=U2E9E7_9GAMM|nr:diaminopimelate decarboxylase [Salinisphaera shabanensis]ERJ20321.1 Diaminopimelate decarboxylase protein [Salinisphaera shabanensis E1L3A]|tara:strand:- start:455 stop:1717 length:1263 start_codon:yes stop_codon:yes gene_type:complete